MRSAAEVLTTGEVRAKKARTALGIGGLGPFSGEAIARIGGWDTVVRDAASPAQVCPSPSAPSHNDAALPLYFAPPNKIRYGGSSPPGTMFREHKNRAMVLALGNSINSLPSTKKSSQNHLCGRLYVGRWSSMPVRGGPRACVDEAPCPMSVSHGQRAYHRESGSDPLPGALARCMYRVGQDRLIYVATHKATG